MKCDELSFSILQFSEHVHDDKGEIGIANYFIRLRRFQVSNNFKYSHDFYTSYIS